MALQITTIVVAFIVPRAVIACYGSEVNGLITSLTQFVSYISLVEAGISAAAVYALYKPLADNDISKISIIVSAARKFYYKSGWIFIILIALLAFLYPLFVDCHGITNVQVFLLVTSLGAMGILDFFTLAKYRVILTASQKNWIIQVSMIIYKVLYAGIILWLSYAGFAVEIVYIVAIAPVIVRTLILSLYTKRKHAQVKFDADPEGFKLDQRWDAFYLQILGVVQSGAPIIIATFVLQDLTMVSVFSIYLLIANGLQHICQTLGTGTQATFGDVIARGEIRTLQKSFSEFQTISYLLNALVCGVGLVLVDTFVKLYIGNITEVNYVYPVIGILAILNVFLYHLKTPQGLLVISAGMYRATRVQTSIQTLILLIGATIGGLVAGIPGILIGCCLSNIYRTIDLMIFIPRNLTRTRVRDTGKKIVISCIGLAMIVLPAKLLLPNLATWAEWLCAALVLVIWGGLVCGVIGLLAESQDMRGIIKRLKRMLGKSK